MSKCIITVKVNGEELKLNLEDSSPSTLIDESFVLALKENPEALNKIILGIRAESLKSGLKTVSLKDLKQEGILANCTLQYLRESPEFSSIDFPDGNANILLVNKLVTEGKSVYGRTIDSNGEEVFIIRGSDKDIRKLAYFLKTRNLIRDYGINLSKDSPYYADLHEVYESRKKKNEELTSLEDMLIEYLSDKKKYTGIFLENGKSAIQVLKTFTRNLKDWDTPNEFDDLFVTALNFSKFYMGDGVIFTSYNDLYKLLKQYYKPLLDNLGITSLKAFSELSTHSMLDVTTAILLYVKDSEGDVLQALLIIEGSKDGFDAILRLTLSTEPDFTYEYQHTTKKGITLKQQFTPISEKYGIAYDTISNMGTEPYRGYTIYSETFPNGDKRCYISRGTLVESSLSNSYNSVEEAKALIDKTLSKQHLRKNSLVEFKFRDKVTDKDSTSWDNSLPSEFIKSTTNFLPGLIIESLNIPIDSRTDIRGDELFLLGRNAYTLQSFLNVIKSWDIDENSKKLIIDEMDTPEKAVAYIYKVNELVGMENRNDAKALVGIADDINSSDYNYYYVEKRTSIGNRGWEYKIIPTDKDKLEEYRKKQNAPVGVWMSAISTALKNLFGVPINLVTSEEVATDLKGVADPNIDKAFIYDGQVYVNTSIASTEDLLHEHVHLVLGILKSNPELRSNYEKLLNHVLSTDEGKAMFNKLRDRYSNLSLMDLEEEVFAKLFSNYMRRLTSIDTTLVFLASEELLKKLTETVFDTNIGDVRSFYGKSTTSIFNKFNKEVAKLLLSRDIDFGSTKKTRKISSWISKLIADGEIIEKC